MVSSCLHAEDHCARLRRQMRVCQVRELEGFGWQTLDDIIHQVVPVPDQPEYRKSSYQPDPTGKLGSSGNRGDRLLKSDATHGISESLY